jgi:hypothetical protein
MLCETNGCSVINKISMELRQETSKDLWPKVIHKLMVWTLKKPLLP